MLIEQVKELSPIERICYWIQERESIRLKRLAGEPPPWTDDTILQSYRFCNVRRMDDKVSRWLWENWYDPYFDHRLMLPAIAVARHFNKPSTLEAIGFPVRDWRRWVAKALVTLRTLRVNQPIFNGAYMVRGNNGVDKVDSVMNYTVQPLVDNPPTLDTSSMQACWEAIRPYHGFGSFMAGQVVADLRVAVNGNWSDRHDWAPAGPGSIRGLNRIHGRPLNKPLKQSEFLVELLDVRDQCIQRLPESIWKRLEAIDFQNTLCETDKYSRTLLDGRKPKQVYRSQA